MALRTSRAKDRRGRSRTGNLRSVMWAIDSLVGTTPQRPAASSNNWNDPCYYHPSSVYAHHARNIIVHSPRISFRDPSAAEAHTLEPERARKLNSLDSCYHHPLRIVTARPGSDIAAIIRIPQLQIGGLMPAASPLQRRPTPRPSDAQAATCRAFIDSSVTNSAPNPSRTPGSRPPRSPTGSFGSALCRTRSFGGGTTARPLRQTHRFLRRRSNTTIKKTSLAATACGASQRTGQLCRRRYSSMPNLLLGGAATP